MRADVEAQHIPARSSRGLRYREATPKRVGLTAIFFANGFAIGAWAVAIPSMKALYALTDANLSLVLLAVSVSALYGMKLSGVWRWIYVLTAMASLYLNVFVLIIQGFLKVPFLHALAPSAPPSEPPFAILQGVVLVFFAVMTILALRRFRSNINAV